MSNYIRFDWAMKRLMRNKTNHVVLEGFLSVLLQRQIKISTILESESNQDNETQKFNRVDLLAKADNNDLYLIEVQNSHEIDYFHRMLFGSSKILTEYLDKGEPYRKLKKVYSINIVYFTIGQGKGYAYHGTTQFVNMNDKDDKLKLTSKQQSLFNVETVSDIFPEYFLFRVNNFNDLAKSSLQEWISFLKTGEIPDAYSAQGLPEARDLLKVDKLNTEDRKAYNRYIEDLRFNASVIDSNREEGRLEGAHNKAIEIARKMLQNGMTTKDIIQITGLSENDIPKL